MEFGRKIQLLRKDSKMSQDKLAEKLNVSRQAISKWEQGVAVPDTDNIVQLSKFFQVQIEYLLFDEFDSVDEVKPISNKKLEIKKDRVALIIIIGFILEVLAIVLSYVMQFYDMKQNECCYTDALEYLRHLPLNIVVIIGTVCITLGVYKAMVGHRN